MRPPAHTPDLAVIGAGQAGLAAARAASRRGLSVTVLESGPAPTGSWPAYYDSLKLFSPARYSGLPGLPFPGNPDRFPHRDEVTQYLRRYASLLDVDFRTRVTVISAHENESEYRMELSDGAALACRALVSATGSFGRPHDPDLPALRDFSGNRMHASAYRSPISFHGQRVLIVGAGNSAIQIGIELSSVAQVSLASRRPIRYLPTYVLGKPIHFWHHLLGGDRLPVALLPRPRGPKVVDDGQYQDSITGGSPDLRGMPSHSRGQRIYWGAHTAEAFDTVIMATGYLPDVEWMRPLQVLDDAGMPVHQGGVSSRRAGVGWVGLSRQRTSASAMLRGVGRDAQHVIGRLQRGSTV